MGRQAQLYVYGYTRMDIPVMHACLAPLHFPAPNRAVSWLLTLAEKLWPACFLNGG